MSYRRLRNDRGQTLVEFALVAPLLLLLLIGTVQFGITYNQYLRLTDAVRTGARKASVSRLIGDKGASAKALVFSAADLDNTKMTVDVTSSDPLWATVGADVTVKATYQYSIDILGIVVKSGVMTAQTTERLE